MGLQHLEGKRSGRPRGARTTPQWVRAVRWASKYLGDLDAVPPSDLAGRLVTMGREHPDKLIHCLALVDALTSKAPIESAKDNQDDDEAAFVRANEKRQIELFLPKLHTAVQAGFIKFLD